MVRPSPMEHKMSFITVTLLGSDSSHSPFENHLGWRVLPDKSQMPYLNNFGLAEPQFSCLIAEGVNARNTFLRMSPPSTRLATRPLFDDQFVSSHVAEMRIFHAVDRCNRNCLVPLDPYTRTGPRFLNLRVDRAHKRESSIHVGYVRMLRSILRGG